MRRCNSAASHCLSVEHPASAGDRGFKNRAGGFILVRWELILEITLKTTIGAPHMTLYLVISQPKYCLYICINTV